jgi:hypothetical protein
MDVRIEKQAAEEVTTILISGELKGQGVAELERVCREAKGPLALDVGNLRSASDAAIQLLVSLVDRGARLTGANPYLKLLLEKDVSDPSDTVRVDRA